MATTLPPDISELEARLGLSPGDLDDTDRARALKALDDATTLALAEVSDAKAAAWTTSAPPVVALIVLKAARREFENPRGLVTESEGDHTIGLGQSAASGAFLTRAEVAQIVRAATGRSGGFVGTIRTPSAYEEP